MRSALVVLAMSLVLACKSTDDVGVSTAPCGDHEILVAGSCFAPGVPKDGCAPGFRWEAEACVPALPASCPPGSIVLLATGACEAVGIATCAAGFVRDGEASCKPVLPATACAAGTFATPGETDCHAPDTCGADPYPSVTGSALYVDASAVDGGDGTRAKPLRTIAAALAAAKDGDSVAITDGTYAENLVVDKSVALIGRCSGKVVLRAADATKPVVSVTAGKSALRSVSITGATTGVEVGRAETSLASMWIHDLDGAALHAGQSDSKVSITASLVEASTTIGIAIDAGTVTADQVVVRETRPRAAGDRGLGISIESLKSTVTSFTGRRLVVERNADSGVLIHGSNVLLESTVIVDTKPRVDGTFGTGINALGYSDPKVPRGAATVRDSFLAGNSFAGVMISGSPVTLERTVVRDTKPQPDASRPNGRGVVVQEHPASKLRGELVMTSSVLERNYEIGLFVSSSDAKVEGSILRTTATRTNGTGGIGVFAQVSPGRADAPAVSLIRTLVDANREIGVYGIGAKVSLDGCTVRGTRPSKDSGWGVHVMVNPKLALASELLVKGSIIDDNVGYGVFVFGSVGTIEDSLVRGTKAGAEDFTMAGVVATGTSAQLTLKRSVIDENEQVGVFVTGAQGTLESVTIRRMRSRPPTGAQGVGLAMYTSNEGVPAVATVTASTIVEAFAGGAIIGGSTASLDAVLIRDVHAEASTSKFGDGLTARVAQGSRGGVSITRTLIERAARAGVAVLGTDASIGSSRISCTAFAIDAEPYGGEAPSLVDQEGNVCGCGTSGACTAVSANLTPLDLSPAKPKG